MDENTKTVALAIVAVVSSIGLAWIGYCYFKARKK